MKKYLFIVISLFAFNTNANPFEIAQNIFQEYRQVLEMIKQAEKMIEQIENQIEIIQNLSGSELFELSDLERRLHGWLPDGDDFLTPRQGTQEGTYEYAFHEWKEKLDLVDLEKVYGFDNNSGSTNNRPKFVSEKNLQDHTIAATAFSETSINQISDRNQIITDYLMKLNSAETMKQSVDLNAQMQAQIVYNQIELNRTMSVLLGLKSAEGQKRLTQERWYSNLFINDED